MQINFNVQRAEALKARHDEVLLRRYGRRIYVYQ